MKKNLIQTEKASKAVGPYSQAIEFNGIVYVSGVIAIDPSTGTLSGNVEEQTEKILTNMKAVLEAAGSSMDKVIKTTVLLNDVNDFATYIVRRQAIC